jgi:hypothetical protein
MLWLVTQALWFGLAALVILFDRRLMSRAFDPNADAGFIDLKDRSPTPFLGLMLIFGGIVLPFYFWYSRRSLAAVLVGIVLMFALGLLVGAVRAAILA